MTKYHDILTARERVAKIFYGLPVMPTVSLERFVALKLIPFIEGEKPHYKHYGTNCTCWNDGL